jgi:hypothetical protein
VHAIRFKVSEPIIAVSHGPFSFRAIREGRTTQGRPRVDPGLRSLGHFGPHRPWRKAIVERAVGSRCAGMPTPLSPWSRPFVFADSLAAIKTCLFIGNAGEPANQCENGAELFSGVRSIR